jgi:MarR-like DNA-binding transcriptional regulator SgrR of sgrS sRNA
MEKLLDIPQLMDRWHCSDQTVKRRLRQMRHMEKPWYGYESEITKWERSREVGPLDEIRNRELYEKVKRRFA